MLPLTRGLALAATAALMSGPADTLRVMRVSPSGEATPTQPITVTFDRPVAGSLDYSVDASRIFRIEPAAPGRVEWRDPVTIAFFPAAPLRPDTRYSITVANTFRAMDGSRLNDPFEFTIRVKGATLLTGSPVGKEIAAKHLVPDSRFELVWSAPVDPVRVAAASYLEFNPLCKTDNRIVRLGSVRARPVQPDDPWTYRAPRYEEGAPQEPDSLRRVVELEPRSKLPYGCAGDLVAPAELNTGNTKGFIRWPFSTYGPLRIAETSCTGSRYCPTGPILVVFSTPVKGTEVQRRVRILPATPFTLRDSSAESDTWVLQARLRPRTTYAIVVDTALRDVFGQKLEGNPASAVRTTGHPPSVSYPHGRMLVERNGFATLAVQHVNVDTLVATIAPVPDTLESHFLRRSEWSWGDLWKSVADRGTTRRLPVRAGDDAVTVTGITLPTSRARDGRTPTLYAVRISGPVPDTSESQRANIALVQVTDLGVHAKIGPENGVVWVTGVEDGAPRAGATVTLYDFKGRNIASARTDARGIARLARYRRAPTSGAEEDEDSWTGFEGYVGVVLGTDRALIGISQYDPDLSPWRFNVSAAWGSDRLPVAGAVFTERGIYRPGEQIYAKVIVREGALGALGVPAARDSMRWLFKDREGGTLEDTVVTLSDFGTADHTMQLPSTSPLGHYEVVVQTRRPSGWVDLARTSYRVAEYRPPEFLVDVTAQGGARFPGDTLRASVQARYLFGAPMARAALNWQVRQTPLSSWELEIPNTDGYFVGESGWWWEEDGREGWNTEVFASGTDTLDATGERAIAVALKQPAKGRAAQVTLSASVTDVNRQVVGAGTTVTVHPAAFYIAAKALGDEYFWRAGRAESVAVLVVRPGGERVTGVAVSGTIVRREWHQVRRERRGVSEVVGEWVSDTVGRCSLRSSAQQAVCRVTPAVGGSYILSFRARDEHGREASTSFYRWATGPGWVPWYDESRFKMDVIPDRTRYSVGDTATVLLASPFSDAEAWITVEREGLIEQRRLKLTAGSTSLRFPITEAYVPNAFVSVFVARGRSAPPGRLDDPGRPTIRVGYTELRVTPEVKRLTLDVQPAATEYRPGDTARVRVQVRDQRGAGQRAEVTLWAVDEGVLSLTGYETPDPLDLLYRPRGLGMRLASNLVAVAPQIPEGEKGKREPGGGGGQSATDILRSRFKTTAFFLGSVVTGADGRAVASAKLPDNLTTFRVMAVAVTAGDRYGSGHSPMLVTRPLIARSALPRFVRSGDEFSAGTVINQRAGGTPTVKVDATVTGAALRGERSKQVALEAGRGREVRFDIRARDGDSATFRFDVSGAGDADAVQSRLAIRPDYHPRTFTASGTVRDTAVVELALPADVDADRSTLSVTLGSSPLAIIRGAQAHFRVYPYYCTEQVISTALPLIALYRAQPLHQGEALVSGDARRQVELAVSTLAARQRADGGIGYWGSSDWTSPWLSAYAGLLLLDARTVGVPVSDTLLSRLADYLSNDLHNPAQLVTPVAHWYADRATRLADRVASVDFLSRLGRADVPAENQLLVLARQLAWEDRVRLAEVIARRGMSEAATALLTPAWAQVTVEGNRATLPDSVRSEFYFPSRVRPVARLLTATLAVAPDHPLIGPLVETLAQQARAGMLLWNTQDNGSLVWALAEFERRQRGSAARNLRVRAGSRVLLQTGRRAVGDSTVPLTGLLRDVAGGGKAVRLSIDAGAPVGVTTYYYVTARLVPQRRPVRPVDEGIQVERWYERFDSRTPITSAAEGDLVRVRLRITVPADRHFLVLDDALPAGLEAVDLSLRTAAELPGPGANRQDGAELTEEGRENTWYYGSWDSGWWSPFDHKEIRDDRVVYFATVLWKGAYTASYVARATTPGVFVRPPAHAEEMYNPAVHGESDGGVFTVVERR